MRIRIPQLAAVAEKHEDGKGQKLFLSGMLIYIVLGPMFDMIGVDAP